MSDMFQNKKIGDYILMPDRRVVLISHFIDGKFCAVDITNPQYVIDEGKLKEITDETASR